jgi:hypothetical protein
MITGLRGASIWSEDPHNRLPFHREDPEGNPVQLLQPSGGA